MVLERKGTGPRTSTGTGRKAEGIKGGKKGPHYTAGSGRKTTTGWLVKGTGDYLMILTHAKAESLEKCLEGNKKDATGNILGEDRTQTTRKETGLLAHMLLAHRLYCFPKIPTRLR